jgi:glycosyltransferase involved in cell wall biosynthesis
MLNMPAVAVSIPPLSDPAVGARSLTRTAVASRWRCPDVAPSRSPRPAGDGPIVLFLPAHDEGPRVAGVVSRAPATVRGRRVEVVVVDDGSTDDTVAEALAGGADVVCHGVNRGLGAAVRTGLADAAARGAAAVAFCDADGEYDAAELERLVGPVLDGTADYVIGSRFAGRIDRMLPHRRLGNRVLSAWIRWVTRRPITDGQSGYRAFSAAAAREAEIAHDYNYAQVLTVDLTLKGFGYAEVPITYRFRSSGRSFVRLGPYVRRVVPAVRRQLASDA